MTDDIGDHSFYLDRNYNLVYSKGKIRTKVVHKNISQG